ncbi:uncharacterized protein UDID_06305 [Ustilago sp. UG-2017a]|nr:uncharacterized protein UDID_06305 [Ustilago sp. UG-2017a]
MTDQGSAQISTQHEIGRHVGTREGARHFYTYRFGVAVFSYVRINVCHREPVSRSTLSLNRWRDYRERLSTRRGGGSVAKNKRRETVTNQQEGEIKVEKEKVRVEREDMLLAESYICVCLDESVDCKEGSTLKLSTKLVGISVRMSTAARGKTRQTSSLAKVTKSDPSRGVRFQERCVQREDQVANQEKGRQQESRQ